MRAHGLRILETILTSRTELIANSDAAGDVEKRAAMDDIALLLQGAIRARGRRNFVASGGVAMSHLSQSGDSACHAGTSSCARLLTPLLSCRRRRRSSPRASKRTRRPTTGTKRRANGCKCERTTVDLESSM